MLDLEVKCRVKMAERRLPGSGEELPKSKLAQAKKPRREEGMETPPSETMARPGTSQELPVLQLNPPVGATLPTLSALTMTEKSGQHLALRSHSAPAPIISISLSWNRPTPKTPVSDCSLKVSTKYRGKQLSSEPTEETPELLLSGKPDTQESKTPSIPSGLTARELAKKLYLKKENFFMIKQLPKEVCS